MPSDKELEIFRQLRESQNKYIYFLLAAAGAAIGFALNQTHGARLSISQLPLGVAVLLWGCSFYCGCRYLDYIRVTLFANDALLKIEAGRHPAVGNDPQNMQVGSAAMRDIIENNSKSANKLGHSQFWFLITGAIFYIMWHIEEMYFRIPH